MNSSTGKPIVSNIKSKIIKPMVAYPEYSNLLPTMLFPEEFYFEIAGVSNPVRNAIRRTVGMELPVNCMFAELDDFKSTDPHHLWELILPRLRMIPLDQTVPVTARFSLNAENNTSYIRDVKSSEINTGKLKSIFNETITICTLAPGKRLTIDPIMIKQSYGYIDGDGMHVMAINTRTLPLDQKPIDIYTGEGVSCSVSDPRHGTVEFTTNGTIPGKKLVRLACENLIDRFRSIVQLIPNIENTRDEYVLTIDGETYTIGVLLMKTICELYPEILAVTYRTESDIRSVSIRMRTQDDPTVVFTSAIKRIVWIFEEILKYF